MTQPDEQVYLIGRHLSEAPLRHSTNETDVNVNVRPLVGPWDSGYSLDKHVLQSVFTGDNEYGHPTFDTIRSEVGEALYQLKYRNDYSQIPVLAARFLEALGNVFSTAVFVLPIPPSRRRHRQPATELASAVATAFGIPCIENLLVKTKNTPEMKDIADRDEKVRILRESYQVYDVLDEGVHDVLIIDDLFDSGASLEAATLELGGYSKIGKIFVATATRKHW